MTTIGAFEAKTHLSALLDRVEKGERITITKHGVPVARLVPAGRAQSQDRHTIVQALKEFGSGRKLPRGTTVRKLIEEGRRF
jgi:prevent-host-death family protein